MNPIQSAADPSTYLTPNEHVIIKRRHHPVVIAFPIVNATVALLLIAIGQGIPVVLVLTALVVAMVYRWNPKSRIPFLVVWLGLSAVLLFAAYYRNGGPFAVIVFLGLVLYVLWAGLDFLVTWVFLTDKRIFRVYGVLTRHVATLPLKALTDIRYDRPILGRWLGYGHFEIESAGQHQALSNLRFIGQPREFYGVVMEEALGRTVADMHRPELPGS